MRGAATPTTPSVGRVRTDRRLMGTQPRWWTIGLPVTMAVVAGFTFYVASNDFAITVAAALLALMMFGGLSLYVGHWTKSHSSTASWSGFSYLHVLIFALAAASQVTHGLGAPSFVFVGLVVVMGVVAVVAGGSCNYYDYACGDPINRQDLNGMSSKKNQPPRPPELEGQCNPMMNTNYEQLSSGICTAYRYAQRTGNTLNDFYRQGYNSLQSPVDVTQRPTKYFNCPGWVQGFAKTLGGGDYARAALQAGAGHYSDALYTAEKTTAFTAATGGPTYATLAFTGVDAVCTNF